MTILPSVEKQHNEFKILFLYPNLQMVALIPSNISLLSACLKEKGFTVDLFDTTLYRIEDKSLDEKRVEFLQVRPFNLSEYGINYKTSDMYVDFREKVLSYKPDLIAVTLVEDTLLLALSLLRHIDDLGIPVLAGGVMVTLNPDMILSNTEIDMICLGEGEEALPELCERMLYSQNITTIQNIWIKEGDIVSKNPIRSLVDINKIPYNDFSIFENERFFRPMQGKIFRMIPVEIDRGCPNTCSYCAAPSLKKFYQRETGQKYLRKKSRERIFEEITYQVKKYDIQYLYFTTETFLTMDDTDLEDFAKEYNKRVSLPFWCQTHISTVTEKRIALLEQMGCNRLSIGLEHGNEEFRKKVLHKYFSNDAVFQAFDILNRYSIPVTVNSMMGFPGETRDLVFDTIYLNRKIHFDSANVFLFTPYHGCELRELAEQQGLIGSDKIAGSVITSNLDMPQLPKHEIEGLLRTFPLYIKMPENRFPEIEIAEKDTPQGNEMYKKLAKEFQETYW